MTDKQIRPPYEIALMHDHILRLEEELKAKEQECEELKKIINEAKNSKLDLKSFLVGEAIQNEYEQQLDQLKAEVKSKTEYIQEQREIICQYSKEIEMYKMCQGKRASKREEELKAKNEQLKTGLKQIQKQFGIEILYCKTTGESTFRSTEILKLKQALTEIKNAIGDRNKEGEAFCDDRLYKIEQILQKCEVLDE